MRINHLMKAVIQIVLPLIFLAPAACPARTAFWYWPGRIDAGTFHEACFLRPDELFINAGRFESRKDGPVFIPVIIDEKLRPAKGNTAVHLVFSHAFDGKEDPGKFVELLRNKITGSLTQFRSRGLKPAGIQFDLEGSEGMTVLRMVLDKTRSELKGLKVSACFHPSDCSLPGFERIIGGLDFFCIMFYDYSTGCGSYRVTDPGWVNRELDKIISSVNKPFFAGLPIYGCITVCSSEGKLVYPQIDIPDLKVFKKPLFTEIDSPGPCARRYVLNGHFSYKYLFFNPGTVFTVFDPDRSYIIGLLNGIKFPQGKCLGPAFFSYPVKKRKYRLGSGDLRMVMSRAGMIP
jgi:hypothetical protein